MAPTNEPRAPALTINTDRLGDLWLPAEREEAVNIEVLHRLSVRACERTHQALTLTGKRRAEMEFTALNAGECALRRSWVKTVAIITERGGLLLITTGAAS